MLTVLPALGKAELPIDLLYDDRRGGELMPISGRTNTDYKNRKNPAYSTTSSLPNTPAYPTGTLLG